MSSKRDTTLKQDLAVSVAERFAQRRLNGEEDNDNDDGGYRGVIIVQGGTPFNVKVKDRVIWEDVCVCVRRGIVSLNVSLD